MCGIAGFLDGSWNSIELQKMGAALAHRGPDASGIFYDPSVNLGLVHRRLSILDLSVAANQPFYSKDGRYIMVYNGEVYNYKEVAAKYEIHPQTTSDTEIIIEAFAKAGFACLQDFNGMFAFAIWDKVDEKLYLVRDRLGVKPLYYYHKDGVFAFASELKGILTCPIDKSVNPRVIGDFLYLGYIPGAFTIYQYCHKLKPGEYAIVGQGHVQIQSYWRVEDKLEAEPISDEPSAKATLKDLLESAVDYCMVSDVPVGVLLSGGVDSSIVAAIAQSISFTPIKTFSIGFEDKRYNESEFARKVAGHIGTEHHEYTVTEKDAVQLVDEILNIYDEPYADPSSIPTLMVSKLARENVTVVLSGDGGDELFMGYGFYYWARRLNNPVVKAFRKPISSLLYTFGNNRLKRGSAVFDYLSRARIKSHIFSQEQYNFKESEIDHLLLNPYPLNIEEHINAGSRILSLPEEQSFFDIENYLPEELLVKIDRASMYHSLESRVPLLDHRLVEFAINLSPELKFKGDVGKYLLKEVLYDYVPASFFNRPKRGFSIPLQDWLTRDLKYIIDKYLSDEVIGEVGLVNLAIVQGLKADFFAGKSYLYQRLWLLILLHKWVLKNNHE
jgi:asparagine synthase (glutamine-hydrolysing)